MKAEIRTYMHQLEKEKALTAENMTGTHGLDAQTVAQIGRQFKADYILRGRIIEFKTRQEPTWAIWKKGLIPFVNDGVGRLVLGYANSESYDDRIETMTARDTSNAPNLWPGRRKRWTKHRSNTHVGAGSGHRQCRVEQQN